ncbi:hypothetical protein BB558_007014 [Smittium angustum]|uniref:Uncharacterized protein n=1 Tax=Smittium angustum TaxID=133377 RepID=A0A2U1IW80_SMIAN|nr:hypothetical protein BB558_007014 [Smittium angustum]
MDINSESEIDAEKMFSEDEESKKKLIKTGSGFLVRFHKKSGLKFFEYITNLTWKAVKVEDKNVDENRMDLVLMNTHIPSQHKKKKRSQRRYFQIYSKKSIENPTSKNYTDWDMYKVKGKFLELTNKMGVGLTRVPTNNAKGSRMNSPKMGKIIDHIGYG